MEGILIHKTPYKERDLICKFLLRNGRAKSVYVYGGQGGGKKQKPSLLELGHLINITPQIRTKKINDSIQIAKEYSLKWESSLIRTNYEAFYTACLMFEVLGKIAVSDEEDDPDFNEFEGLFSVLSNSLFYMHKDLAEETFNKHESFSVFMVKLIFQLGIVPQMDHCSYCRCELTDSVNYVFQPKEGGFSCSDCVAKSGQENFGVKDEISNARMLNSLMRQILTQKFNELKNIETHRGLCHTLFNYFCYQFEFEVNDFKSYQLAL